MGQGAIALSLASSTSLLASCARIAQQQGSSFPSLSPSSADALQLATGLNFHTIAKWGDPINSHEKFGFNNDFCAFFPLSEKEGLLCVNHEYPNPLFVSGYTSKNQKKSRQQIEKEMESVGASVIHIKETAPGVWQLQKSPYNRRITGSTPIPFARKTKILGSHTAIGTLANCAGGSTPWGTYLTCEENYDSFYGEIEYQKDGKRVHQKKDAFNWYTEFAYPPEHYGWVVEINPKTGESKKLTSLGRFAHESATVKLAADGRPVVYTGDDCANEHLYKFISDKKGSLETGTLYVANLEKGQWIPLRKGEGPLKKFRSQTELLIRTREAAKLVGATPLDRPEDIEVCPKTNAVFVSLTNNTAHGNYHGSILKLEEKLKDPLSLSFSSSTFFPGGELFSCPDNLAFDPRGNLWMTTDIPGSGMNKGPYAKFKNNGLFYFPMEGAHAGKAFLMATAPTDSELTGPCFSPDGKTLFLSVQHPGEESKSLDQLTSHWPDGGNALPRPAVVAISGPLLDSISSKQA